MTLEALENSRTSWTCGSVCFWYILLLNVIIYFLQKTCVASTSTAFHLITAFGGEHLSKCLGIISCDKNFTHMPYSEEDFFSFDALIGTQWQ